MKNHNKTQSTTLTKILLITCLLAAVCISAAFSQSVDFSGVWNLNKQKTDFGGQPQWLAPAKYVITQSNDHVRIDKTMLDSSSNELKSTVILPFDGSKVEFTTSNGTKATNACSKDSLQNIHISIAVPAPDGGGEIDITEIWSLADGRKTLIVNRNVAQYDGLKYTIKAFYDKND